MIIHEIKQFLFSLLLLILHIVCNSVIFLLFGVILNILLVALVKLILVFSPHILCLLYLLILRKL